MAKKKMQTVCGYSCSDCDHHTKECPGCEASKGKPFWTAYVGIEQCQIYSCCTTEQKLPHCGKCPDLMCERFNRIKEDPSMNEAEAVACLTAMEQNLRARK